MTAPIHAWPELQGRPFRPLQDGLINDTYAVGNPPLAVVQRLHPVFAPEVNLDIDAITTHLAEQGLLTPRVLRTRDDALWHVDAEGRAWRALSWVPGRTVHGMEGPAMAAEAGGLVARWHAAVADLDHRFAFSRPGAHDTEGHMASLRAAVVEHHGHRLADPAGVLADAILAAWSEWSGRLDGPAGITHGDLKVSNIRFDDNGAALCLLDLDTMGRLPIDVELGDAWRSWCNPHGENTEHPTFALDIFGASARSYLQRRPLSAEDREALPAGIERICLELAARFAADALSEAYFGWDPAVAPTRGDHNLLRARCQLELAGLVRRHRAEMEEVLRGPAPRRRAVKAEAPPKDQTWDSDWIPRMSPRTKQHLSANATLDSDFETAAFDRGIAGLSEVELDRLYNTDPSLPPISIDLEPMQATEVANLRAELAAAKSAIEMLERAAGGGRFELTADARLHPSPRARALLGLKGDEPSFAKADWLACIDARDQTDLMRAFRALRAGRAVSMSVEVRLVAPEARRTQWLRFHNEKGETRKTRAGGWVITGTISDDTRNRSTEAENARLSSFVHRSPHPVLEVTNEGRVSYQNPAATRLLGELGLSSPSDFLPAGHHVIVRSALEGRGNIPTVEVQVGDRELSWLYQPLPDRDEVHLHGMDITERKLAERELLRSRDSYVLAAEGSRDGLWDWDTLSGHVFYSKRWRRMLGYSDDEPFGETVDAWFNRVHPHDLARLQQRIDAYLNRSTSHCEIQHRVLHRSGEYRWMVVRGAARWNGDGRHYRMAGSLSDITERKRVEQVLQHGAFHDALTGLPNRAAFLGRLGKKLRRTRHSGGRFAVLFLDLDRFKVVNDSLGHAIGDELLKELARRLENCVRPDDMVARLSGDEFTVLLHQIEDADDAIRVAERVHESLMDPFALAGYSLFAAASIGIALCPGDYDAPEDILRDADTAMYDAKAGKKRHAVFSAEMRTRALRIVQLDPEIRRGLREGEFRLEYQPIIDLESGLICGVEALARWEHPSRGFISPGEFIPVAEETGTIVALGDWVLHEATRQMQEWTDASFNSLMPTQLRMSVNISRQQVMRGGLLESLEAVLEKSGIAPGMLALEITESSVIGNPSEAAALLQRVKDLGVHIHMDDFGTGYSSLSHLERFPIDALKIDRSFIRNLDTEAGNAGLVRSIVDIGRALEIDVIAEGVETVGQLNRLREMQCANAQGFLFARSLRPDRLVEFISEEKTW